MATRAGATVWLTGLSGAGKSTIAAHLAQIATRRSADCFALDGDRMREGLNADLGFGEKDRAENVRRLGEVALLLSREGRLTIVAAISPFARGRDAVRRRHEDASVPFVEVYVATPLGVCEERDPKGLYARARSGEIDRFTGVSDRYEVPEHPELVVSTATTSALECAEQIAGVLESVGALTDASSAPRSRGDWRKRRREHGRDDHLGEHNPR